MNKRKQQIILCLLVFSLIFPTTISQALNSIENNFESEYTILTDEVLVDKPIISVEESGTSITIPNIETFLISPGIPKIPVIKKTFTFPKGTTIIEIMCIPKNNELIQLEKPIKQISTFKSISGNNILTNNYVNNPYEQETFPEELFTTQTGAGITKNGEHVNYLTITIHPIQYHPLENTISFYSGFDIEINQILPEPSTTETSFEDNYDLAIITPNMYQSTLNAFVDHKNNHGVNTLVKTTSEIYNQFQGRDKQEKIKYFVKHAIETYNTKYVLLIGDINQLPIRQTDAYPWESYHGSGILTDLYYSDIYDASYSFATWDTNNNDVFGEVTFDSFPPSPDNIIDEVDLYPDVHIGRIPCSNLEELSIVLSKIITYEQVAAYQTWFQQIILAGGDTFPLTKGSPFNVLEGEITNVKVGQQIPEFEQIKLWASKGNLNAKEFNQAISNGAGFLSYAGHGFEHGWGTYRPNAILDWNLISYFTPFLQRLSNTDKYPIIFFDACLTTKLDFNIEDLTAYYGLKGHLFSILLGFDTNEEYFPCFAWAFLKLENAGGIATVGATRPAYTYVDKDGVYAGAGFLDVRFFHSYEEGITVGEMLSSAQTDYQNYVGKDMFTIEEYILLGDPSLRVGGYL